MGRSYKELADTVTHGRSDPSLVSFTRQQSLRLPAPSKAETSRRRWERWRRLRKQLLSGCLLAYVLSVLVGCFSFIFWGCLCHDPLHGYPNEWNSHECTSFGISRNIGTGWCCAVGGMGAVHLYVTVPICVWIARFYQITRALRTALEGLLVGAVLVVLIVYGVADQDPPPGFGIQGIPLGGSIIAGLVAWLLIMLAACTLACLCVRPSASSRMGLPRVARAGCRRHAFCVVVGMPCVAPLSPIRLPPLRFLPL